MRISNLLQGLLALAAMFGLLGVIVLVLGGGLSETLQTRLVVIFLLAVPIVGVVILGIALLRPWLLYAPLELAGTAFGNQSHPQTRTRAMKLAPSGTDPDPKEPKRLAGPKR
jgi:hypothetical protein